MNKPKYNFIPNDLKKDFSFVFLEEANNKLHYYCSCGNSDEESGDEIQINSSKYDINFDEMELSRRYSHVCKGCEKDFKKASNYSNLFDINKIFMERYDFEENETELILYKSFFKAAPSYFDNAFIELVTKDITIETVFEYLKLNKTTKKLYYKPLDSNNEIEFDLDKVFKIVSSFFHNKTTNGITDNLIAIHNFLNKTTDYVADANNMDIITELMSQMIGSHGLPIFTKITSIFFGIICYSNLSTIALTKGLVFLYDMLNACTLPKTEYLKENKITSPIKIFSYLINLKNNELIKEIEDDDSTKNDEYVYMSFNEKKIKIKKYDASSEQGLKAKIKKGKISISEDESEIEKKISPYIFNSIKQFSDYEKLIKLLKFISYKELIEIVMKYDIVLIKNIWNTISNRDRESMNVDILKQFLDLGKSYAKKQTFLNKSFSNKLNKRITDQYGDEIVNNEEQKEINFIKDEDIDYSSLQHFELDIYDDCINMILNLKWDPKKEFHKIKNIDDLIDYHNKLSDHYNVIKNEEKNKTFTDFTKKFLYLENYDFDGLKVNIIKTPELLLSHAKKFKNCSASYIPRITEGKYLMCIVYDYNNKNNNTKYTEYMMGLRYERGGFELDAVKGYCNVSPEKNFREIIRKFMEEKDISYKDLPDIRLNNGRDSGLETIIDHLQEIADATQQANERQADGFLNLL
jgi:hypothetical protein